ncbi:MAG: sulfotransferase, partial [Flavobacteriales bacterium]|nr:sulfotransferase [Flavobacteriales bacterium]
MKVPNFMCLGVTKSGTTSLYDILIQHPEIYIPKFKEPHFFDITENFKNGVQWYSDNYF